MPSPPSVKQLSIIFAAAWSFSLLPVQAQWVAESDPVASAAEFAVVPAGQGSGASPLGFVFQPLYPQEYTVWARVFIPAAATETIEIAWNATPEPELQVTGTGQWIWVRLGRWNFATGDYELSFNFLSEENGLDRIWITPNDTRVPLARGPRSYGAVSPQTYEEWATAYSWEHATDSQPDADPDADLRSNSLERFFASNPLSPDGGPLALEVGQFSDEILLTFSRAHAASNMEALIWGSNNLVDWFRVPVVSSTVLGEDAVATSVALRLHTGSADSFFWRIEPANSQQ